MVNLILCKTATRTDDIFSQVRDFLSLAKEIKTFICDGSDQKHMFNFKLNSFFSHRFIQFCIDSKGYRGCDFKPTSEDDQDLIARLKRVHLDSKEALDAVESAVDDTVTQAEQPAWHRHEEF